MTVNNEMKIGHPYSNIFNIFLCPNQKPIQIVSVGIIGIVLSTLCTFLFILLKNQDFGKICFCLCLIQKYLHTTCYVFHDILQW